MRVIKAFFIALKQWLRLKAVVPTTEIKQIDLTPTEIVKIGQQSKEIVQAHAQFKADWKRLTYSERKALKNKYE